MSRRTDIINTLINHISTTTNITGHRGMKFLHEINSFPTFYVHVTSESRVHIGADVRYGVISLAIRGYQWADNLDEVDSFGRNIETAIQTFRDMNHTLVEEARVTSFKTDEGIMEPYGSIDVQIAVIYAVN